MFPIPQPLGNCEYEAFFDFVYPFGLVEARGYVEITDFRDAVVRHLHTEKSLSFLTSVYWACRKMKVQAAVRDEGQFCVPVVSQLSKCFACSAVIEFAGLLGGVGLDQSMEFTLRVRIFRTALKFSTEGGRRL